MKRAYGFTIVELLIVIVVIAILAALSYVGYTSISNRAHDSSVQSDLSQAGKLISIDLVETGSLPSANTIAWWTQRGFSPTKGAYSNGFINSNGGHNFLYCAATSGDKFAIIAWTKSDKGFALMDGSVRAFSDTPVTSATACPNAGINPYRTYWMYSQSAWHF